MFDFERKIELEFILALNFLLSISFMPPKNCYICTISAWFVRVSI